MRKPQVRPPRTPRGEDPRVTIGNLENHIALLTKRCEDLVKNREQEATEADRNLRRAIGAEQVIESLQHTLQNLTTDASHLRGYQERVREEDRNRYGDLQK